MKYCKCRNKDKKNIWFWLLLGDIGFQAIALNTRVTYTIRTNKVFCLSSEKWAIINESNQSSA